MDYSGIYTPSDQRSRPWRGQSFSEAREGPPCAPSILRAHAFFDAQNLFHSVKSAYGYRYPNYDPIALAHLACRRLDLRCDGIHFYTGVHDPRVNPFWHEFWTRKLQVLGTREVTPETAWLLSEALNTTPEFWMNLQAAHDLARTRPRVPVEPLAATA
ncbi:MAG: hypothetical protein WBJ62_03960 [Coriobacteriia bacterium]